MCVCVVWLLCLCVGVCESFVCVYVCGVCVIVCVGCVCGVCGVCVCVVFVSVFV